MRSEHSSGEAIGNKFYDVSNIIDCIFSRVHYWCLGHWYHSSSSSRSIFVAQADQVFLRYNIHMRVQTGFLKSARSYLPLLVAVSPQLCSSPTYFPVDLTQTSTKKPMGWQNDCGENPTNRIGRDRAEIKRRPNVEKKCASSIGVHK